MSRFLSATFSIFFLFAFSFSIQAQNIEWEQNYGGDTSDLGRVIQKVKNGGYIVGGSSESSTGDVGANNGASDYWVMKIGSSGSIEWEKNYGGTQGDNLFSIQEVSYGGYIVLGWSSSSDGDVSANNGSTDYWAIKLDDAGAIEWEKNYGGTSSEFAKAVLETGDKGFLLFGYSYSSDGDVSGNNGSGDLWLVKIDSTGAIEWDENYGGSDIERAGNIHKTYDGGYILTGESSSSDGDVGGNMGGRDYWALKIDSLGNIEWEENYGGSGKDVGQSVLQRQDSSYVICGFTASNDGDVSNLNGNDDVWIVSTDQNGVIQWEKTYGGSGKDWGNDLFRTSGGDLFLTANSRSSDGDVSGNEGSNDYWLAKLDSSGNILWERNYGGSGYEFAESTTREGSHFITAGFSGSNDGDVSTNQGAEDYWVIKTEDSTLTSSKRFNEADKLDTRVYPNPTTDKVTVEIPERKEKLHVTVSDVSGKRVRERDIENPSSFQLELGEENGLYIVELRGDEGKNAVIRVLKE